MVFWQRMRWIEKIMCIFAVTKPVTTWQGGSKLTSMESRGWEHRLYGQLMGKDVFWTLPVCVVKSRKFESFHSGNATKRSRGCIISRLFVAIIVSWWLASVPNYIMSLGVGWLALLILERGQCESLTTGIGTENKLPRLFYFQELNQ